MFLFLFVSSLPSNICSAEKRMLFSFLSLDILDWHRYLENFMSLASSRFGSAKSSERIFHQFERSPYADISSTALTYQASPRIDTLAKPRLRRDTTIRDGKSPAEINGSCLFGGSLQDFADITVIPPIRVWAKLRLERAVQRVWPI